MYTFPHFNFQTFICSSVLDESLKWNIVGPLKIYSDNLVAGTLEIRAVSSFTFNVITDIHW